MVFIHFQMFVLVCFFSFIRLCFIYIHRLLNDFNLHIRKLDIYVGVFANQHTMYTYRSAIEVNL